ncbi:histidinol dehydrogenase [Pseudactinotalea sp. Z1739]|uniref:histidinol dehydrogenase n=1 Tax=Pseudactinotalea sp. Z1739 TaxID=3413028 RepID=UPI003C7D0EB2
MMRTIDLRNTAPSAAHLRRVLPRAEVDVAAAIETVRPILERVRQEGAPAIADYTEAFDGVTPASMRVPQEVLARALAGLVPDLRAALTEAIGRARKAHRAQLPGAARTTFGPGAQVHQRWVPVRRVGLYVPGGLAVYPSSVVMNVVPAQEAGVTALAVASPPQKDNDGWPDPVVLASCALLGVEEVYAVGGAQAVGMFAHGVEAAPGAGAENACEPVDVITGPGNIYVAAAKRAVLGLVGIDSEAGTTEIAVLADETAQPAYVAADLISQAEHDPAAASVLITDSGALADQVAGQIEAQTELAKHAERIRRALTGPQSAVVLVQDLDQGVQVVNAYAAEHLEIHTRNAAQVAERVHNAGAIFLGSHSPVPLGDYLAGSNHVLPTGGTARFASGLGVMAYLKSMQVIDYDAAGLAEVTDHLVALAAAEDLPAHGTAVVLRRTE